MLLRIIFNFVRPALFFHPQGTLTFFSQCLKSEDSQVGYMVFLLLLWLSDNQLWLGTFVKMKLLDANYEGFVISLNKLVVTVH